MLPEFRYAAALILQTHTSPKALQHVSKGSHSEREQHEGKNTLTTQTNTHTTRKREIVSGGGSNKSNAKPRKT